MSVPYKIESNANVNGANAPRASEKIPIIARPFVSERAKKTLDIVRFLAAVLILYRVAC